MNGVNDGSIGENVNDEATHDFVECLEWVGCREWEQGDACYAVPIRCRVPIA